MSLRAKEQKSSKTVAAEQETGEKKLKNPFFFFYERQVVMPDTKNIFKFKVHGELQTFEVKKPNGNDEGKTEKKFIIKVTLDDLESGRHFSKPYGEDPRIPPERVESFRKELLATDFVTQCPSSSGGITSGNPNYEKIVIGYDDKLSYITYYDNAGSSNTYFSAAVKVIESFITESCGLPGIMATRKEILEDAAKAATAGNSAYENYEHDPKDL